ncbi:MAG: DUF4113 domain-containing protein [Anaerohalosphaera sp.]|nr:DUF4113 domain-containing protein [Anaerohalosphaera sp.]
MHSAFLNDFIGLFTAASTPEATILSHPYHGFHLEALDRINLRAKKVYFASEGIEKPWQTKFNHRSARYTTRWNELVKVV